MKRSQAERRAWHGWTLVDSTGRLVLIGLNDPEPFTFYRKRDAKAARADESMRVVRCKVTVIRAARKKR